VHVGGGARERDGRRQRFPGLHRPRERTRRAAEAYRRSRGRTPGPCHPARRTSSAHRPSSPTSGRGAIRLRPPLTRSAVCDLFAGAERQSICHRATSHTVQSTRCHLRRTAVSMKGHRIPGGRRHEAPRGRRRQTTYTPVACRPSRSSIPPRIDPVAMKRRSADPWRYRQVSHASAAPGMRVTTRSRTRSRRGARPRWSSVIARAAGNGAISAASRFRENRILGNRVD
jgi:hypothetical protein